MLPSTTPARDGKIETNGNCSLDLYVLFVVSEHQDPIETNTFMRYSALSICSCTVLFVSKGHL